MTDDPPLFDFVKGQNYGNLVPPVVVDRIPMDALLADALLAVYVVEYKKVNPKRFLSAWPYLVPMNDAARAYMAQRRLEHLDKEREDS